MRDETGYSGLPAVDYKAAVANRGNQARIKRLFWRAGQGERLTVGFLGGSITQGSLASAPELCYAYQVYRWWCDTFPQAEFTYVNAGIGATDSQFACARAKEDLLRYRPDLIVVEFSVNDAADDHYLETYEGLVRGLYGDENKPALLLVHNVRYDDGRNAQPVHGRVAFWYDLPAVSMQSGLYPQIASGKLERRTVTPDDLHPNDLGHRLVASVICRFLEEILADVDNGETERPLREETLTRNAYEHSLRLQNDNASPVSKGFTADPALQESITDLFKKGWTATQKGASIVFEVKGSCVGVQYRRTVQLPAPVAEVILDQDEAHPFLLDANFDETWGDKLALDTVLEHGENRMHRVEIRLRETHPADRLPFYLVSVIVSG